jgi:hypothetical protein
MRKKVAQQKRACELRATGWSLRQIAAELGVALSSVSVWVRDVIPDPAVVLESPNWIRLPIARGGFKVCGRCHLLLPLESFNRHSKSGRQHWCRECFKAYFRERGSLHRRQVQTSRQLRLREARALVLRRLKASSCADCGARDVVVLDFDHITGSKTADVTRLVRNGYPRVQLEAEFVKCEVVCANRHRRRTAERQRSWRQRHMDGTLEESLPVSLRKRRNLLFVRDILASARCIDCGELDIRVLEFDHVREKRGSVTKLMWEETSLKSLEAEIAKCEIRCANCHRKRTAEIAGHFRHHA